MKKILAYMFLGMATISNSAQSLSFHLSDGNKKGFNIGEIDSIAFRDGVNLMEKSKITTSFYYAPSWNKIADPTLKVSDGVYTTTWKTATSAQWQAQMFFTTDISTSFENEYDFSVSLISDKKVNKATLKLYEDGQNELYYFEQNITLEAGKPVHFEKKGMEGIDMKKVCLLVDIGGNTSNTTLKVSNISLREKEFAGGPNMEGYRLVWYDEFNGTTLSSTKWTHEVKGSGWVNNELQNYVNRRTPKGAAVTEVSNGTLKINCLKEGDKIYSGRIYGMKTSGFKYCYIEASIKLPKGKGTWPAFWMMPVSGGNWPACGEIDIMEEVGVDANIVSSSIHCSAYNHPSNTQKTHSILRPGAEEEFHTYAMEWTADYIQTYVDGHKQLYFPNDGKGNNDTWPFNKAFYPILNLAWGGDWGGYAGVDDNALPVTMEVDYVRIYKK